MARRKRPNSALPKTHAKTVTAIAIALMISFTRAYEPLVLSQPIGLMLSDLGRFLAAVAETDLRSNNLYAGVDDASDGFVLSNSTGLPSFSLTRWINM
jgi:hypothetical protein